MSAANFADRLISEIEKKNSCLAVGIDPRIDLIPAAIKSNASEATDDPLEACAAAIEQFSKGLIDAVADLVPAVKPQVAFYERFGWQGFRAFCETAKYAKAKGLIVIGDVKRSDIGSTVRAYADGLMGMVTWNGEETEPIGLDAVTVNAYFGADGIQPFLDVAVDRGKGMFVLVRTSNPSAAELQDVTSGGQTLYEIMAERVGEWGASLCGERGYSAVGAVVGATYPDDAKRLRQILPKTIFLMPGVGAQQGDVDLLGECFDAEGQGVLIAAARSIDYAYQAEPYQDELGEGRWQEAAAEATKTLNDQINATRFRGCKG
ncbi:MAG: orotidine-5'-phosphate decarboxylase [Planctomycetes bacterium]|nr:orotidine-5'-phosphate decarboxylase [Planctomycetota bacterium]